MRPFFFKFERFFAFTHLSLLSSVLRVFHLRLAMCLLRSFILSTSNSLIPSVILQRKGSQGRALGDGSVFNPAARVRCKPLHITHLFLKWKDRFCCLNMIQRNTLRDELEITTWLPDTWALLTRWWPDLSNLRGSWPMTKFPVHICCPLAYRIHTRAVAQHIGAKLAVFQSPYFVWVRHVHHLLAWCWGDCFVLWNEFYGFL